MPVLKSLLSSVRFPPPFSSLHLSKPSFLFISKTCHTTSNAELQAIDKCTEGERRYSVVADFLLKECGLSHSQLPTIMRRRPSLLRCTSTHKAQEALQVLRDSGFAPDQAVDSIGFDMLENKWKHMATIGVQGKEIKEVVMKYPQILALSIDKVQRNIDFLVHTVGFEPNIVTKYPTLLAYSIKNRILPRYKVMESLGLTQPSKNSKNLANIFFISEQTFAQKFVFDNPQAAILYENYKSNSVQDSST